MAVPRGLAVKVSTCAGYRLGFSQNKLAFIFCRSSTSVKMDGLYASVAVQ